MGSARKRQDQALEAIYAEIPDIPDCKGLCHDSCGPIPLTRREHQRVHIASGVTIPRAGDVVQEVIDSGGAWTCPALTEDNLCAAYAVRPLVCRLYGAAADLPCRHGCTPTISAEKANELKARVAEATGDFLI